MAELYPIVHLKLEKLRGFPAELEELFEEAGLKTEDEFTYTTRYSIDPENEEIVDRIKVRVREELDSDDAERFIELMEAHRWDVSFLVDCW